MYQDRAEQIVTRLLQHLDVDDKVLDIGCGTGVIAKTIAYRKGLEITLTDVVYNPMCDFLPVIIYNGQKLPFGNNNFNASLLIATLHHCDNPLQVLDEAIRVTSGKIIIMEDVFSDFLSRTITFLGDCLINWEIHSPFTNHTKEEWMGIFQKKKLPVVKAEEFNLRCAGFPFKLAMFVLDAKKAGKKVKV